MMLLWRKVAAVDRFVWNIWDELKWFSRHLGMDDVVEGDSEMGEANISHWIQVTM